MTESAFPPHSRVQFPRGTTAQNNGYIGKLGELTMDSNRKELRLHDGIKPGGHRICSLTELQSLFLSLESEAANLNFPNGSVGFLTRVSDQQYATRKLIPLNGLTIQNPTGIDDPNDSITGDPIIDLPPRLQEAQVNIVNASLHAIQTGFYACSADTLNVPDEVYGKKASFIMAVRETDQSGTQVLMTREEASMVFIRSMVSGSWQPWINVSPFVGDLETLMRGTDDIERAWSAKDLEAWMQDRLTDMSSGDTGSSAPTLYNSKRMFREKRTYDIGGSSPSFVQSISNPKVGDRFKITVYARTPVDSPNGPAENGCDVVISLKLGGNFVELVALDAPARNIGTSPIPQYSGEQFTAYSLVNSAKAQFACIDDGGSLKVVRVDADWVITKDFSEEGIWNGDIEFDASNGTRQLEVACYRIRPAT